MTAKFQGASSAYHDHFTRVLRGTSAYGRVFRVAHLGLGTGACALLAVTGCRKPSAPDVQPSDSVGTSLASPLERTPQGSSETAIRVAPRATRALAGDEPSRSSGEIARLVIAYSDEPGFREWVERGERLTPKLDIDVSFVRYGSFVGLEALAAKRVDAVLTTNADVLVNRSLGEPCTVLAPLWVTHGSEALWVNNAIRVADDLRGKTIGLELGSPEHLWLHEWLTVNRVPVADVHLTDLVPEVALATSRAHREERSIDGVVLPLPESSTKPWPGYHRLGSSAEGQPFLYGVLCASPDSAHQSIHAWARLVQTLEDATPRGHTTEAVRRPVFRSEVTERDLEAATSRLDAFFVANRVYTTSAFSPEDIDYQTVP